MKNEYKHISIDEYHAHDAISRTTIMAALKSPRAYKRTTEGKFETTASMALGDAVHAHTLEEDRFNEMYELSSNKAGEPMLKNRIADIPKITPAEYVKFENMTNALAECGEWLEILKYAKAIELSFFATVTVEGQEFKVKVRPDLITKDGWLVDLKTCGGMNDLPSGPDSFSKSFFDYGYDVQMVMNIKVVEEVLGKRIKGMKFVCVDAKKEMSGVKIYEFARGESNWWKVGESRMNEGLLAIEEMKDMPEFPVYEEVIEGDLPLSYNAMNYAVERELI